MTEPIKVFVGTDVNSGCAECQMVFEYSLRKHASQPVEITWMMINDTPGSFWSGWDTSQWSTPFSGFRWGIPEYCKFEGRAIYCDDDQLWLTDVAELWNASFEPGKIAQAKWHEQTKEIRYCVMLWDCAAAKPYMLPLTRHKAMPAFHQRMTGRISGSGAVQYFDRQWNNYDGENDDIKDIKLLHFTDMSTNPGVKMAIDRLGDQANHWYNGPVRYHRRQDIVDTFNTYYQEALAAGYKLEDYITGKNFSYAKQDQSQYVARNGFDVTQGE